MRARARWSAAFAGLLLWIAASAVQPSDKPATPPEHVRGVEQTLLTYPEWFLVFSPYEYGEFLAQKAPPSAFPFYGHIGQFWQGYRGVVQEMQRRALALNPGYHLMVMVIGTSTTVEYGLKSAYEMLVGRLVEAVAGHDTEEDRYAAAVAQDYVRFIRVSPWYQYDFAGKLKGLWSHTGWTGPGLLRKWERKFALTTEYAVKAGYGQLIKLGTQSVYDAPLLVTAVVVQPAPLPDPHFPDLQLLRSLPGGAALATIPRYEAFMVYAQHLADGGANFAEIAGNRSFILVSLLVPQAWQAPARTPLLFAQPILTRPGTQRVLLTVPVDQLGESLRRWKAAQLELEHVYDY